MNFVTLHKDCIPESLYLHYPLCKHHCSYCDFNVVVAQNQPADFGKQWLQAIDSHLEHVLGKNRGRLETLYLGGGTPSLLTLVELSKLKQIVEKYYDLDAIEWTIECNPETLTREKLEGFLNLGVNRLSLGVQTFLPDQLKRLERLATAEHIEKSIGDVQDLFKNFSLDLMIGIADQSFESLQYDLKKIESIRPPHLSVYLLTLDEQHKLKTASAMKDRLANDENAAKFYQIACEFLESLGYHHYEVSNFAQPGFASRHNSNYWNTKRSYLGIGPGAHGYVFDRGNRIRYENIKDPKFWSESASGVQIFEALDTEQQRIEDLYLRLRTRQNVHLTEVHEPIAYEYEKQKWLNIEEGWVRLTTTGWLIIESLTARLIR